MRASCDAATLRAAMGVEAVQRPWRRRAYAAACVLLGIASLTAAPGPAHADAPAAPSASAFAARVAALVDAERRRHGLPPLARARCAEPFATRWADRLGREDALRHQRLRPVLAGCGARRVAENVAMGAVSPEEIVRSWMGSRRHRANVLDRRLTHAALAARRARSGRWYVVQNFVAWGSAR